MNALEISFWVSTGLVIYTFVGYPAALWAISNLLPARRPESDQPATLPHVTVIVVARNEGELIGRKIDSVLSSDYPKDRMHVLVASDGSTDNTAEVVKSYASRGVSLLAFGERRGKAACLNDGVASARTDYIVMTDARQRLAPNAIRKLLGALNDRSIGAVSGELVFEDESPTDFSSGIDLYWRYEKFIRNLEARLHSTIGVTGALYALRREGYRALPHGTVLDDLVVPMRLVKAGFRVSFEPGAIAYDRPSRDAEAERRRKVRTLFGNWQFLSVEPWTLIPWRNRLWWQFVSHKVLRLLAPAFLVLTLVSSALLARSSAFFAAIVLMQAVFYGAPLCGSFLPRRRLRAILMAPLAFVHLNWFAAHAFVAFVTNREAEIWR